MSPSCERRQQVDPSRSLTLWSLPANLAKSLFISWSKCLTAFLPLLAGIASRSAQFLCTHYTLLAHAAASARLREIIPGAQVSMNFNSDW